MRVVIVTPTYNERENIATLLDGVLAHGPGYSAIVVDDNSPDGTAAAVEAYADPRVTLIRRAGKNGLGRAYTAGFLAALQTDAEYIVQMDADLSHDPATVPALVHVAVTTESDLVLGSRYIAGGRVVNWPWRREVLSRLANQYARIVLGRAISDYTAGFAVIRADALRQIPFVEFDAKGFAFLIEFKQAFQTRGMRIAEAPITFVERQRGKSKLHGGIVFEALRVVWDIRRRTTKDASGMEPAQRTATLADAGVGDRRDDA